MQARTGSTSCPSVCYVWYIVQAILIRVQLVKYVPEWLPGAGFKKKAREWKKLSIELRDRPFELLKAAMVRPVMLDNLYIS
jgi:hypothetical protein